MDALLIVMVACGAVSLLAGIALSNHDFMIGAILFTAGLLLMIFSAVGAAIHEDLDGHISKVVILKKAKIDKLNRMKEEIDKLTKGDK